MSADTVSTTSIGKGMSRRDHALLIGDGFLLTMGTVTVGVGVAFGLSEIVNSVVLEIGSGLLMLVTAVAGVVGNWLLHGRRVDLPAVVGGMLGSGAGGLMIPLVAGTSFLLGLPLKLVSDSEYAGPLATLALMSLAVLALIVWLIADAVRDMRAERIHYRLDIARIAAAAVFGLLVVVSVYLVFAHPAPEQGEAPIWSMAAGLIGAGITAGADLATVLWDRRSRPPSEADTAPE